MKIAMYWHNGRSLGHTSEVAKISEGIIKQQKNINLLGVTGAFRGLDMLPDQMEIVKVPGFENFDTENGLMFTNKLNFSRKQLFELRSKMLRTILCEFEPEYLVVNHEPYGLDYELKDTLGELKKCRCILSLRGVIYGAEETNRDYFNSDTTKWINQHYESILIHTDPNVFCLEDYYEIPKSLQRKMHYVGYLEEANNMTKEDARKRLGIDNNEKVLVASMGGGQGAYKIWLKIIEALKANPELFSKIVLITGPYLEQESYKQLCIEVKNDSTILVIRYSNVVKEWIKASDLFIGAAGANMISEILSLKCNSIVIPRQISESEQLIHATILNSKGFLRMCTLEEVYRGALKDMIKSALLEPIIIRENSIMMNGALNYNSYIQ